MATKKAAEKNTAGQSSEAVLSSIITDDMFATPDTVIEHPVKLGDGKERTMYFRPLTSVEWKQHLEAENSKDPKVRTESAARLIAKCVVEPNGRRAMTPRQAASLKAAVSGALFMAILEINDLFKLPKPKAKSDEDEDIDLDLDEEEQGDDIDDEEISGK